MRLQSFLFIRSLIFLLPLCTFAPAPLSAAKQAFIVGVDRYDNLGPLRQLSRAVNDARALAEALAGLGFDVTIRLNPSQSDFFLEFDAFNQKVKENDVVAFYFSGHGLQIGGLNYLLPADAPPPERTVEDLLKGRALQLNALLDQLARNKPSVRFLIIDACRDNPYRVTGRSIGGQQGLASIGKVKGTFIMFSADAGQTALDSLSTDDDNKNSPYTRSLVPLLRQSGHTLPDIARRVRFDVEQMVASVPHDQSPSYYDGISGDFCLTGDCKSPEDLRREVERLRREEFQQREELESLRGQARDIIQRIEQTERNAREKRKDADLAQSAARDAESRSDKVASLPPEAHKPEAAADDPVKLTRDIQAQLQRLQCYRGEIDGVWGDGVKTSLQRFAESTKFSVPLDAPTQTALTVLSGRSDPACAAGGDRGPPVKKSVGRPNALSYSMHVWAGGSVQEGVTVSTNTPHGRLTCVGGNYKTGRPRVCHWN